MSSPFADFKLTTLEFLIDDGAPGIDETGNFTAPKTTLPVKALLNPANRSPVERSVPGELMNQIYLKGVLVEPMQMPPEILPGHKARTTFGGRAGTFTLALTGPDSFGVAEAMGYPIEGTFSVTANQGN